MLPTADYNYFLPPDLIAQTPALVRDQSRLLLLNRPTGCIEHRRFTEFPNYLRSGDVLVLNNSKVIPARLRASKEGSGGSVEVLLLEEVATNEWWVMLKPGKRVRCGTILQVRDQSCTTTSIKAEVITAEVIEKSNEGHYRLIFHGIAQINDVLTRFGEMPLPPYIRRPHGAGAVDAERYQTVFAQNPGSVAAPTAGLHFTPEILETIRSRGVEILEVTLHVGFGTFAPVKAESLSGHRMHEERYTVSDAAAESLAQAKARGGRVVAVGTTSLRVLESVAAERGRVVAGSGKTRLFVYPPYQFKVVDALLTNFHLPESTLLMLVSAFASPGKTDGRTIILDAYAEAIREQYRFFSYGDAMFII